MINFEKEVRAALKKRSVADFIESNKKLVSKNKKIYVIGKMSSHLRL